MRLTEFETHPISLISKWKKCVGGNCTLYFSKYSYVPQTVSDSRIVFSAPITSITPSWLDHQLEGLEPAQELAFHSRIRVDKRILHIPMIDFAIDSTHGEEIIDWAAAHLGLALQIFYSGRSFHAYGLQPIPVAKWTKFMGLALLANLPGEPPIVDARWVGHRLLAGYSALRWSSNSRHYLQFPHHFAGTVSPRRVGHI